MSIVTVTSDWSKSDYYLSALKGKILSYDETINIVEISNSIEPLDVIQAMFVLGSSFFHFPKGTIHLLAVASESTEDAPMIIFQTSGYYFVGINDGRFFHLSEICQLPDYAYSLRPPENFSSFMAADQFAEAVKIIHENSFIRDTDKCEIKTEVLLRPLCNESSIIGKVIYIDSFGNAVTNIKKELFDKMLSGRGYEILVQGPYAKIPAISKTYSSVKEGALVAIFNSLNCLEIAINCGNVSEIEGLSPSSEISIHFFEETSSPFVIDTIQSL